MLLIFTGNGKGKTTSALGAALRSAGWKKKTAIVFFDKGGEHYGEQFSLDQLKNFIDVFRFGERRFDAAAQTFRFENEPRDRVQAQLAQEKVLELLQQGTQCHSREHIGNPDSGLDPRLGGDDTGGREPYFLIVCDEIINCLNLKMLTEDEVRAVVAAVPKDTHLILTGRNAPEWLIEKADLVSEVQMKKHYFGKVKGAVEGIDF